jgi:hypothetical protein
VIVALHDHAAHDIRGHQVRRELNARVLQLQGTRQRSQQRSLAESRHSLQQDVSACQQADQDPFHHIGLADDHFADLPAHRIQPVFGQSHARFVSHVLHCTDVRCSDRTHAGRAATPGGLSDISK